MTSAQPGQEQRMEADMRLVDQLWASLAEFQTSDRTWLQVGKRDFANAIFAALTRPTADLGEDGELVERLGDEADLCRNEGASDIASLLDQARSRLILYREALEGLVAAVEKDADENNGISGYTGARLSDARAVLSRSGG